jgi:hypothetical protein
MEGAASHQIVWSLGNRICGNQTWLTFLLSSAALGISHTRHARPCGSALSATQGAPVVVMAGRDPAITKGTEGNPQRGDALRTPSPPCGEELQRG